MAPPLMGVVPSWVGVFLAYGTTLKLLGRDDAPAIACAGQDFIYLFWTIASLAQPPGKTFDHFSRISQLCTAPTRAVWCPHAPCGVLYTLLLPQAY